MIKQRRTSALCRSAISDAATCWQLIPDAQGFNGAQSSPVVLGDPPPKIQIDGVSEHP